MPPLTHLPSELTCRICPHLTDDVWVARERRDVTVDRYVEAVLNLALWIDMRMLTSVFKSLFGKLMLSKGCLTLPSSYRGTL